jgi:hypothetical protein
MEVTCCSEKFVSNKLHGVTYKNILIFKALRPGADGKIILRWIFRKWDVGAWTESSWLRTGTVGGYL